MSTVLQFFARPVIEAMTADSVAEIRKGKYSTSVLAKPCQAIVPTSVGPFRGDATAFLATLDDPEYQGYAVPAGTVLTWETGERGQQVAGGSAFLSVDEDVTLIDLGIGTSKALGARFDAYVASLG